MVGRLVAGWKQSQLPTVACESKLEKLAELSKDTVDLECVALASRVPKEGHVDWPFLSGLEWSSCRRR